MTFISQTPKPPYYAVVFTQTDADTDHADHNAMSLRMIERASHYEGFLGIQPGRNKDGTGIAVSCWRDLDTIQEWAMNPEHRIAKQKGQAVWYDHHIVRVAKVEREYGRPDR